MANPLPNINNPYPNAQKEQRKFPDSIKNALMKLKDKKPAPGQGDEKLSMLILQTQAFRLIEEEKLEETQAIYKEKQQKDSDSYHILQKNMQAHMRIINRSQGIQVADIVISAYYELRDQSIIEVPRQHSLDQFARRPDQSDQPDEPTVIWERGIDDNINSQQRGSYVEDFEEDFEEIVERKIHFYELYYNLGKCIAEEGI